MWKTQWKKDVPNSTIWHIQKQGFDFPPDADFSKTLDKQAMSHSIHNVSAYLKVNSILCFQTWPAGRVQIRQTTKPATIGRRTSTAQEVSIFRLHNV